MRPSRWRHGVLLVFACSLVLLVAVGGVMLTSVDGTVQQPTPGDSWPMEGYDSGQTAVNPAATGPDGDVGPGWISVTGYGPGSTVSEDRVFVAGGQRRGEVTVYDAADGTREWRTRLGDAISSKPMVDGDTVYVHTVEYRGRDIMDDHHEVVALDADTGAVEWRFEADDDGSGVSIFNWKTLTVADGALYIAGENYQEQWVGDETGFVVSIDEDGAERWRTDLGAVDAHVSRPAVDDGTAVVAVPRYDSEDELVALNTADGSEQWHTAHPHEASLAPPAVDDGSVYVNARTPLAVDLETGAVETEYDVPGKSARPLAVADDMLFVPGGPTREWAPTQLFAVDRASGNVEWSYGASRELSSRPVASEEMVFVGGGSGMLFALDREDGTERWTYEVSRDYMIHNEPAIADETLYVGPVDNRMYAFVDGGDARDPAVIGFISRFLPVVGDFAGFAATVAVVYLAVGTVFGVLAGTLLYGLVAGLRFSRTPLQLLAARVFRVPLAEVTRRQEFGSFLLASVAGVLLVGIVSALSFGAFPVNGLLAAVAVVGGAWAVLVYRWLPSHPEALDREKRQVRRQWGVVLAIFGVVAGLLYPLVVFVILLGIYFT